MAQWPNAGAVLSSAVHENKLVKYSGSRCEMNIDFKSGNAPIAQESLNLDIVVSPSAMYFASSEMRFSPLTVCASALRFNGACLARRVSGQRLVTPSSVCWGPRQLPIV